MIYLDHHSTTPLDPDALAEMLPVFKEQFANAGSITHAAGRQVGELVSEAIQQIASLIGASQDEIVITSGATESNNLALFGVCLHPRQKKRRIVSVVSEHKALLDPLARLEKQGFEVIRLPVGKFDSEVPGRVDLEQLEAVLDERTALVSVMLANNEIGIVQPLWKIAQLCRQHEVLLHTDATQAVGRIPVSVDQLGVDLLSFSAHKFYGPKGIGGLFVRRRERRVRLWPQIVGGGQQHNLRSGTLNSAGIVGMAAALKACAVQMPSDAVRIAQLRSRLFDHLSSEVEQLSLNGPEFGNTVAEATESMSLASNTDEEPVRLHGNLNCCFYPIEGQSLMLETPELAVSSGSACTSAEPSPSHVLLALGLTEEQARSSLRFGIGRFNTEEEIDTAADWIINAVKKLKRLL